MVANTGLYEALIGVWKTLHPLDPQCRQAYGDDHYRQWIPAEGLIHRIHGSDGRYQVPWKGHDYAIVACDVKNEHWVVVRIHFSDWVVELYDSLLYQMDDPSDRVHYERRDRELMPLLRLLPRLLICAGFLGGSSDVAPMCFYDDPGQVYIGPVYIDGRHELWSICLHVRGASIGCRTSVRYTGGGSTCVSEGYRGTNIVVDLH
ncbi:hypothetical protein C2S52_021311 [Perilla frutescens var. hirtella]|nr:hypothetical protein C2S52_021311 [Perilla frutescens var. hirtella]